MPPKINGCEVLDILRKRVKPQTTNQLKQDQQTVNPPNQTKPSTYPPLAQGYGKIIALDAIDSYSEQPSTVGVSRVSCSEHSQARYDITAGFSGSQPIVHLSSPEPLGGPNKTAFLGGEYHGMWTQANSLP